MSKVTINAVSERAAKATLWRLATDHANNLVLVGENEAFSGVLHVYVKGTKVSISSSYYFKDTLAEIADKAKGRGKVS